jgi:integrase/transposase-like protein
MAEAEDQGKGGFPQSVACIAVGKSDICQESDIGSTIRSHCPSKEPQSSQSDTTCIAAPTPVDVRSNLQCPECGSRRLYKDGIRDTGNGPIQRFLCRNCGYRFSEKRPQSSRKPLQKISEQSLNTFSALASKRQICAILQGAAKNLSSAVEIKTAAGSGEKQAPTPSIIIEFQWRMKKRNLADITIKNRGKILNHLLNFGADLMNPESVETVLATEPYTQSMKYATVNAYKVFCRYYKIDWEPIKTPYQPEEPFIPLEEEIDCLIAACGKLTSAFTQVVKDTGARKIEVLRLRWTDLNFKDNTISINRPAKGSNPRTVEVPATTLNRLNNLPKIHGEHIFKQGSNGEGIARSFRRTRRKLADKLQNPRLMEIHFHTLRHWRATMEYAKTREIYAVKQLLGHKCLKNTDRYQHMVKFPREEYITKVAKTVEQAQELLTAGFRFECDYGNEGKIFIRRK